MQPRFLVRAAIALGATTMIALLVLSVYRPVDAAAVLTPGKADLKSAGALAFGPDGVLFVGDSIGGAIVALDTNDKTPVKTAAINVQGLDQKIAGLVGVMPDQILINDVAVNPISKNVYVSAARGRGPDAAPLVVKVEPSGKVTPLSLDNIPHASVALVDAPADNPTARQNPRTTTITDMAFINGNLLVTGMSNEEWNSALRSIPYPFNNAGKGTQLQIWHASHGRFETQAPVRTFVPYTLGGQPYVLAAYTCTPLVKIPMSDAEAGRAGQGRHDCRSGFGQPAARHGSVQEGRPRVHPDREHVVRRRQAARRYARDRQADRLADGGRRAPAPPTTRSRR